MHYNLGVDVCDRHADSHPSAIALIEEDERGKEIIWTFQELKVSSNRLANALRGLGCERKDRIAVLLSQSSELPIAHIAIYKLGAIAVPLFALFGPDALLHRLNDSGAKVVITDAAHAHIILDLRSQFTTLQSIIVTDQQIRDTLFFTDLQNGASPQFDPVRTRPADPAVIIYTSGTTGPAKGALHGHQILLGHLPGVSLPHDFAPHLGDRFWTPADWAWIGGLFDVLFPALHWGVPVVAHRMAKFDPEQAFTLMERKQIRNVFLPPTSLKMMRQIQRPRERWHLQLRTITSGGEPLGQETLDYAKEQLGVTIHEFYGQTECNVVLGNCSSLFPVKANSMGRPIPGHRVEIIDANGQLVKCGEIGEIAILTPDPVMFLEYWKQPHATKQKFIGDWLCTGDLGYKDEDGYFHFVGRKDDVISSAGYRIGPSEIEETLTQHPAVLMAAAVGSPDPVRGEIVKAFVKLRAEFTQTHELAVELQQWVKTRLGAHEYPREIEFVTEFPMTPSGKIQRHILKKREQERKSTRPST
ncbi:AMP-dependent synthetase [Sulfoacidibacillus thermotolerans]|uniref:AMP-dependent synthetase n=2 Tax=Sulfoacidibacillus thermotolerans TaxID=1765684 RepID=A0A2U3D6Y3_SULT2|nr:AMP-dependent synthetase [Sulfoacidibacillus thermotolerans]